VRSHLQGVFPPRNPAGSFGSAFPQAALDFMHQFDGKQVAVLALSVVIIALYKLLID